MDFLEYYIEFKNIMKRWCLAQIICDIIFVGIAVVIVLAEKMLLFAVAIAVFFFAEYFIINRVFGSLKSFTEYLNLREKYQTAHAKGDEDELEKVEKEIIEYMKEAVK